METTAINPKELTSSQLRELLAETEAAEANDRVEKRKNYEALRNDTVFNLINKANTLKDALKDFKTAAFADMEAMYKLLQEHSSRHADGKGNFTLESTDKLMKIMFKRYETTKFDERATQADKYFLDFLTEEFAENDPKSKAFRRLLERKKGQPDKDNVLIILSLKDDFHNSNLDKAAQLYQESITDAGTKYYVQFFVRLHEGDEWQAIVLDFARI